MGLGGGALPTGLSYTAQTHVPHSCPPWLARRALQGICVQPPACIWHRPPVTLLLSTMCARRRLEGSRKTEPNMPMTGPLRKATSLWADRMCYS